MMQKPGCPITDGLSGFFPDFIITSSLKPVNIFLDYVRIKTHFGISAM